MKAVEHVQTRQTVAGLRQPARKWYTWRSVSMTSLLHVKFCRQRDKQAATSQSLCMYVSASVCVCVASSSPCVSCLVFSSNLHYISTYHSVHRSPPLQTHVWHLCSSPIYTIQPVVKPVVKPVWQPVERTALFIQPVGCLFTRYNRLWNWLYNRFHNRLYRGNGVSGMVGKNSILHKVMQSKLNVPQMNTQAPLAPHTRVLISSSVAIRATNEHTSTPRPPTHVF